MDTKRKNMLTVLLAVVLVAAAVGGIIFFKSSAAADAAQAGSAPSDSAQAAAGTWQKVEPSAANLDAFSFFKSPAALCVGKEGEMNAMTIGWGQLGNAWGKETITVYVRQSRFTKHLMDKYDTFTVEVFPKEKASVLEYFGTKSGRDEDKIKGSGLTLKTMENGAPAFEEGAVILECRKLTAVELNAAAMKQELTDQFYTKDKDNGNFHTAYTAEITAVWVKK